MSWKLICISSISCLLAGMGIGGGSLFIILGMIFLNFDQKMLQGFNLIMFINAGITATMSNIKNKKVEKKLVKQILPELILGAILGVSFAKNIDECKLRLSFLLLMVVIGIYEIITSLINIKKAKDINI